MIFRHTGQRCEAGDNNIQVFVRIKPQLQDEPGNSRVVDADLNSSQVILRQEPKRKVFAFDYVADVDSRQETIFAKLGKKVIENCIAGYNGTIFAYGQTGSGKTFTMMGPSEDADNFKHEQRGVIPRSFEYLYSLIAREKELHGDTKQFLCKCSFLEIYNEQIYDLLEPTTTSLHLRESLKTGVYVAGLSEQVVNDASEAYEVLSSSWMNRKVASTSMNRESSRSHAVFTLQIESKSCKGGMDNVKTSSLHLVDLAGSERQKDTHASGLRLKEAGSINKSLSNLGKVIMCLVSVSRDGKKRFVPYRDSKLTFLLRDSLGGNSKTSLIACVHAGYKCFGETLSTLLFAKRAKMIKNKAILNENSSGNVEKLKAEIKLLKAELEEYKGVPRPLSTPAVEVDMPVLREMFLQAMRLRQAAETEKQDLHIELEKLRELCMKKDKAIQTNKMIIKFRDNNIKRLGEKIKGQETCTQEEDLLKEIEVLRSQIDHHPHVAQHALEIQRLKTTIKSLREDTGILSNIHKDTEKIKELEESYHKLLAGDKPELTPQRAEMTSTATIERMRSQMLELEAHVEKLKEELRESQQSAEKNKKIQESEIESFKSTVAELETIISANNMRTKLEKDALNEMHRQTVLTITTPKKERYQLRNRTVVTSSTTPDLDTSIPFEENTQPSPSNGEGIFGEVIPDEVAQQAQEALFDQIKLLQEQNASLESRIGEYDTDRVKNLHELTVLKSQIQGMEELLNQEREVMVGLREQLTHSEPKLRAMTEELENTVGETRDLKLLLDQADKQIKEYKEKIKQTNAEKIAAVEDVESKFQVVVLSMQQIEKSAEKLEEEKVILECYLEDEKDAKILQDDLIAHLQTRAVEYENKIKQLEQDFQSAQQTILEEKDLRESLVNQLSYEGIEKDREMVNQLNENKQLVNEYNSLKNMLEAHEDTADKLRKALEDKDAEIIKLQKNIKVLEDKVHSYFTNLEKQNDEVTELKELNNDLKEEKQFYLEKETSSGEKLEKLELALINKEEELQNERQKNNVRVEMLNEDIKTYQENIEDTQLEYERSQEQLALSETNNKKLQDEINTLTETLKQKEEASKQLQSNKSTDIDELTKKLQLLESVRHQRTQENKLLKVEIEDVTNQRDTLYTESELLKAENLSLKERSEAQTVEMSDQLRRCINAESRAANVEADRNQAQSRIMELESSVEDIKKENEELIQTEARLEALLGRDTDTMTNLKAQLDGYQSNIREMTQLFGLPEGEELQIDDLLHSIKTMKDENIKLLKETTALVGHSNHKQKIKFHETVKNENLCLKKEVERLRLKLRHYEQKMADEKPIAVSGTPMKENIVPHHKDFLSGEYTQRSPHYSTHQH